MSEVETLNGLRLIFKLQSAVDVIVDCYIPSGPELRNRREETIWFVVDSKLM